MLMKISSQGNQLLQFNEPWKTIKEDEEQVKAVINMSLQIVAVLSVITHPFLPETSAKMRTMLKLKPIDSKGALDKLLFNLSEGEVVLKAKHKLGEAEHLFSRVDDELIEAQMNKLKAKEETTSSKVMIEAIKDSIQYDDFAKMDIRVARIKHAEKVAKADKLLKLELELGEESRTVVSGIAEHYKPEEIVGKYVSYLANLAPRKLRGIESQGMILLAEDGNGKLSFVTPEDELSTGSIIK